MNPLCVDLFCGLGGWADGFLSEGYDVIGFDNGATAPYAMGAKYPGWLVLQDVLTVHGSQFPHASVIVASSPCQEFSYRHMPWKKAKALGPPELGIKLFQQAFRIQREACEAADRFIPLIAENVVGAQKWVGRAPYHFGSYYLWGDIPALMPLGRRVFKVPSEAGRRTDPGKGARFTSRDCGAEGIKIGGDWFSDPNSTCRRHGSRSNARRVASAQIAKIPFELASHIARVYKPRDRERAA